MAKGYDFIIIGAGSAGCMRKRDASPALVTGREQVTLDSPFAVSIPGISGMAFDTSTGPVPAVSRETISGTEVELTGGSTVVVRIGATVRKPVRRWSPALRALLHRAWRHW